MTTPVPATSEIADRLARVRVDRDRVCVSVDDTELEADTLRDLRQLLSGHLYSHWHIRREPNDDDTEPHRDFEFEKVLSSHTPHERTVALVTAVDEANEHGPIVVLDGVRVQLPDGAALESVGHEFAVSIPACRPALSPGFWLADSSVGRLLRAGHIRRFYLAIDERDEAPIVWRDTLSALESAGVRYRAKVGSTYRTYPRSDSMVVYVDDDPVVSQRVSDLLVDLVDSGLPVGDSSSLFIRSITRGIGTAEEPRDARPGMSRMSFGEHRCFAVATGILDTPDDGDGPDAVRARVERAFLDANIRPDDPAFNNDTL